MLGEIIKTLKEQKELLEAIDTSSESKMDRLNFRDAVYSLDECIEQLESL